VYANLGGCVFADGLASIPHVGYETEESVLGDLDGDGDLDVFVCNGGGGGATNYLNRNLGGLAFDMLGYLTMGQGDGRGAHLTDLDLDGDLDAVVAMKDGPARAFLNDGSMAMTQLPGAFPATPPYDVHALAAGDLDSDGDDDVVLGRWSSPKQVLRWNGAAFHLVGVIAPGPIEDQWTDWLDLADFDDDGDLDLLEAVHIGPTFWGDPRLRLHLYEEGVFVAANDRLPAVDDPIYAVALGDVDDDDDVDVFLGNDMTPDRVLVNLTRHTAWKRVPAIGKQYQHDVYGVPGEAWALAWSPAPAAIPLPPFGTLYLDPAGLKVAGSGVFGGGGTGSVVVALPSAPALVGWTFFVQALVGAPPRLTNLEITTLTDL